MASDGSFKFSAALGLTARPAVAEKEISCRREMSDGSTTFPLGGARIDPEIKLQFRLDGDALVSWLGNSREILRCVPASEGEVVILSVLFFYDPPSVMADGDELSPLEVPVVVPRSQ